MRGWVRRHLRVIVAWIGVAQLAFGLWMAISPATFFDTVGGFGAENHHYVRDMSTVYLALGLALLVAARRPGWAAPVLLVAALQYGIHAVNHLLDVGEADPSWVGPFEVVTIAVGTAVLAYLFDLAREE